MRKTICSCSPCERARFARWRRRCAALEAAVRICGKCVAQRIARRPF